MADIDIWNIAGPFATGRLVWRGNAKKAPATLVGYDVQRRSCGVLFHRTPFVIVRACEADGNAAPWVARCE